MLRVNILIHVHTAGLRRDLRVFREVLRGRPVELTITAFDPALAPRLRRGVRRTVNSILPRKRYDMNIFDETIDASWVPFARVNGFTPHQEWLTDESRALLPMMDVVLCKTRYADGIFAGLGCRTIYTGFTTLDRYDPSVPKDFGACLHIGGSSLQKGSMAVNRVWLANPDLPDLKIYWYEPTARPVAGPNVRVETAYVADAEVNAAQNRCGIQLCTSEAEGFGHYIVEAMGCGAVVLTTDAPPMNELVQPGRGVLVGYDRQAPQAAGMNFYVDEARLAYAVREVLALPMEERARIGRSAREWFLENDRAFRERFWEVLQGLG
jgi:hypothetical protein